MIQIILLRTTRTMPLYDAAMVLSSKRRAAWWEEPLSRDGDRDYTHDAVRENTL